MSSLDVFNGSSLIITWFYRRKGKNFGIWILSLSLDNIGFHLYLVLYGYLILNKKFLYAHVFVSCLISSEEGRTLVHIRVFLFLWITSTLHLYCDYLWSYRSFCETNVIDYESSLTERNYYFGFRYFIHWHWNPPKINWMCNIILCQWIKYLKPK